MDNGQATGPETIDDLADFLVEHPEADATEDLPTSDEPELDSDNSDLTTDEEGPAEGEEGDEPEALETAEKQTSNLKFKVPVKGEDGSDTEIEVDEKELVSSYMRHADYTRKTQELAHKEREATQIVVQQIEQGRNYFMEQAQLAHAAVRQLAGLRSQEEMVELAQRDPGAYVAEQARERAIQGVLSNLEQGMHQHKQQGEQQSQAQLQESFQRCWGVIGQKGIDKPKLQHIFESVMEGYGVPREHFAKLSNPALILIMRDAVAYRELEKKKASVSKQAQEAPRLPAQRQSVPKSEQVMKRLNQRFTSGNAGLNDLASFISQKKL